MKKSYSIDKIKIKNGLFKHEYIYRVYQTILDSHSIGSYKLFEGSLKECKNYLRKIKEQ